MAATGTTIDRPAAVEAEGLRKRYGAEHALDGFDLSVPSGTVCALLGPNGAGKTTAVRVFTTLLRADGGRATVAGIDVARHPHQVRTSIGLSGQVPAVDEILSGRQNLVLFARLHGQRKADARRRAEELLARFGLIDAADKPIKRYSGGMRRRLDLAVTPIGAPEVLFLDEPTTGLDPRNRAEVWAAIRELVAGGTSVLLTTQYLDEADQLADQVAVIDAGRTIATGTPDELKAQVGRDRLEVALADAVDLGAAVAVLGRVAAAAPEVHGAGEPSPRLSVAVPDRSTALAQVVQELADAGIGIDDLVLRRPTLDDVFLHLTGRPVGERPPRDEEAMTGDPPKDGGAVALDAGPSGGGRPAGTATGAAR